MLSSFLCECYVGNIYFFNFNIFLIGDTQQKSATKLVRPVILPNGIKLHVHSQKVSVVAGMPNVSSNQVRFYCFAVTVYRC